MAKKKSTRKSNATVNVTHEEKAATKLTRQPSMEEDQEDSSSSEEKVQNLKSLNAMLLKQTVEKRQQIDSLAQAKNELETELARRGAERGELRSELDEVSDENLGLRMELGLVMDFVGCRFREMGVGVRERDDEIRVLRGEVESGRERLREVCDEREVVIEGLKGEKEKLVEERRMREELEKAVEEKKEEVEGLKGEMEVLLGVKNEMEIVKRDQRGEIDELERKFGEMSDTVESLRKEEKVLRDVVIGLEKNLDESIEKERVMMVQIDVVGKEKRVKESELERLMEEKSSVEKQMEIVNVQCFDKEKLIKELSREKIELEERIFSGEAKRVELNQKVDELERAVAAFQKDCNDRTETNEKLRCKVGELRNALEQVELERKKADKAHNDEREDLKTNVSKSEKMIETTLEELEKMKKEAETMKLSTEEAHKKKSFWTVVSSVTTIFAAASFAYASRTR